MVAVVRCSGLGDLYRGLRCRVRQGKLEGDGGTEIWAWALGSDASSVLAGYGADEEQAKAGSLDFDGVAARHAIEAFKDALEVIGRQAEPIVGDAERDHGVAVDRDRTVDVNSVGRIFHCVVQQIEDGGAQVFWESAHVEMDTERNGIKLDCFSG